MPALLLLVPSLAAASAAPECGGCSREQKELIEDLSSLMDELVPDPADLEEIFEAGDLGPPPGVPPGRGRWAEALLPSLGLKVHVPLAGPFGRHVTWEVFFFFNWRR